MEKRRRLVTPERLERILALFYRSIVGLLTSCMKQRYSKRPTQRVELVTEGPSSNLPYQGRGVILHPIPWDYQLSALLKILLNGVFTCRLLFL